ncbi:MAG TPA: SAM-dependent chlorinase/fluorinase [Pyrinomonadaceae bacterium]|nr:SAM-dependent chlorinase/fluorinase [Pyrinomonadaceae bacterium]
MNSPNSKNSINRIALLTDFGTRDYFVGAIKGAILSICETVKIIDITHEIEPQNIQLASFTLRACYENFPKKTIFVAVVDPGVGSNRRAILVETTDYFFVAPDNGLLSFVFDETENFRVFELTNQKYFAERVSRTFHGRDVFAPVAAHLANGVQPNEFGAQITDFVRSKENIPHKTDDKKIEGEVIHIDHFGNLITNFRKEDLPAKFYLETNGERIEKLRTFFAEAEKSEIFMIFGSAGFLEIVAFQDSAENLLKAKIGDAVTVVETN